MAANSPLPIPLGDTTPGQIETPELNTSGPQQSDINAGLTPDQNIAIDEQIALENKYGESPLKAAALGAVDTGDFTGGITTFLTSPTVGKAMGQDGPLMSPEDLHQYALRNNKANLFGQVAGVAAPLVTGVGEVASGLSAIKAVGSLSEKTFAKMLLASGGKEAASVFAKAAPRYLGSAVEGSAIGLGNLVKESDLGDADLNAQNALVSAGMGGVFGVAGHALFSGLQSSAPYISGAGKVIADKTTSFANPNRAAADIAGLSDAAQSKLQNSRPDIYNNIAPMTRDAMDSGIMTPNSTILKNYSAVKDNAIKTIGNTIDSVDASLEQAPPLMPARSQVYSGMLDEISNYKQSQPLNFNAGKIEALENSIIEKSIEDSTDLSGPMKASEMQNLRQFIDKQISYDKLSPDKSGFTDVAKNIRSYLSDQVDSLVRAASDMQTSPEQASLFSKFKKANLDYGTSVRLLDSMTKKLDKSDTLSDISKSWGTAGVVYGAISNPGAAAIAAGSKLSQTDFFKKIAVYSQIERSGNAVNNAIDSSATGFFKNIGTPVTPSSLNAVANSALSRANFQGNKPKDPNTSFANIGDNLNSLSDGQNFINTMQNKLALLQRYAPDTSSASATVLSNAVNFLKSKMPVDPKISNPFQTSQWTPSSVQKAQFERYLNAVENPMSVIKDLKNGSISPEAVEALKAVYPKVFAQVQTSFLEKAHDNKGELTYNQRVRLGTLLGISTDSSLNQESLMGLQAIFAPFNQKPVGPSPAAAKPVRGMASNKLQHIGSQIQTPFQESQGRK